MATLSRSRELGSTESQTNIYGIQTQKIHVPGELPRENQSWRKQEEEDMWSHEKERWPQATLSIDRARLCFSCAPQDLGHVVGPAPQITRMRTQAALFLCPQTSKGISSDYGCSEELPNRDTINTVGIMGRRHITNNVKLRHLKTQYINSQSNQSNRADEWITTGL